MDTIRENQLPFHHLSTECSEGLDVLQPVGQLSIPEGNVQDWLWPAVRG